MFEKRKKDTELEEIIDLDEIEDLEEIDIDIIDLDKEKVEEKEFSWKREIIGTAIYLLGVIAVTLLCVQYVGQRTYVNGDSMNATLEDGDNLMVDKLSYRFKDPERYDIIVFPYQYQEKTYYIKRIIGMPGETVQIIDGMIYVDGEMLAETYGTEVMKYAGVAGEPITLGEDEYFVLGDNRNNSSDSRDPSVGNIKEDQIVGKAFIRIWPFNKFGILKHQ